MGPLSKPLSSVYRTSHQGLPLNAIMRPSKSIHHLMTIANGELIVQTTYKQSILIREHEEASSIEKLVTIVTVPGKIAPEDHLKPF